MLAVQQILNAVAGADLDQLLIAVTALMARVGPVIWIAPFLGGRVVPATVKTGVIAALAVVMYPHLAAQSRPLAGADPQMLIAILGKEVLIGTALGFLGTLVFWAAQSAGSLVDISRGAGLGEVVLPFSGGGSTPMGVLMVQLTVVLFIALGGHRIFIAALASSYDVLPLATFPRIGGLGAFAVFCSKLTGQLIALALLLAGPAVAAVFLADLALGWINRFAPQINVFFFAMPLKAVVGIAAMAAAMGLILAALPASLDLGVRHVHQALDLLATPPK